jgi:DNA-binding IclR family transcriptional regulator
MAIERATGKVARQARPSGSRSAATKPGWDHQPTSGTAAVAVERAVEILLFLAEDGEASITQIAKTVGVGNSAAHRILAALKNRSLVDQSPASGLYSLSWGVLALTHPRGRRPDLRTVALPFMVALRDLSGETVTINARSGNERVCIEAIDSHHEISFRAEIGRVACLYAGASGKVILANFSREEFDNYLTTVEVEPLTPHTVTNISDLAREMTEIRRVGYALGLEDRTPGVCAVSAPILADRPPGVVGSLSIVGPCDRCTRTDLEAWAGPTKEAATEITRRIRAVS